MLDNSYSKFDIFFLYFLQGTVVVKKQEVEIKKIQTLTTVPMTIKLTNHNQVSDRITSRTV